MEHKFITLGDDNVYSYTFDNKREIEVDEGLWFAKYSDESIIINDRENFRWNLSTEDLCTFIKLLVSHLELPLEFK